MLLGAYVFITVVPATLVIATYAYNSPSRLSDRLVNRLDLNPSTSTLLHGVLVGASSHRLLSTVIAVGNVVVFGSGYGRILQLAHARAWRLDLGASKLRDHERYFAVLVALIGLVTLWLVQTTQVADGSTAGLLTAPLWLACFVAYFVWAPRILLHHRVVAAQVLPGAVFVALGFVALRFTSRLFLARWLTWYSTNYGGFGIILAIFSWLVIFGTLIVVGAALSPPLAARRELLTGGDPSKVVHSG